MSYKEICNKHISKISIELLNSGMPMHRVSSMTLEIYEAIKKHLEENENEIN